MSRLTKPRLFYQSLIALLFATIILAGAPLLYFLEVGIEQKKQTLLDNAILMGELVGRIESHNSAFHRNYKQIHDQIDSQEAVLRELQSAFEVLSKTSDSIEFLIGTYEEEHIHFIAYNKTAPPHVHIHDEHLAVPMRKALSKQRGTIIDTDYNGNKVFAAYVDIPNTDWGLVIKQDYQELSAPYYRAVYSALFVVVLIFAVMITVYYRSHQRQDLKIKFSEERFQHLVESSHDLVWEINKHGVYTYVSPQIKKLLGYDFKEVLGKTPFELMPRVEGNRLQKKYQELTKKPREINNFETVTLHKNGQTVHLLVSASPFFDQQGHFAGYRGIDRDITSLKEHEAEITQIAYFDSLTGLANREQIMNRLEEELEFCRRTGRYSVLMFMDLDGFKDINDSIGHDVGDEVLIEVARRLQGVLRSYDVAGRLGGDEFIALMRSTTAHFDVLLMDVETLLKRLLSAINKPIQVNDYQLQVGVSIGVALMPRDGDDVSELLRHADAAMYEAKNAGKNQYHFYHSRLQEEADRKLLLKNEINKAFLEDQFELYYHRQTDVSGQHTRGFEALIRWNHPSQGLLAPSQFLHVIEEFNLTTQLDEWVIDRVCFDIQTYLQPYIEHFTVSINLTPMAFNKVNLLDYLLQKMAFYHVSAEQLTIEVTEGALIQDLERTHELITKLSDVGFNIALDDFGTGYSSLSYLSKLNFDTIKMDGSFMRNLFENEANQNICKLIISLANDLDKAVVAEGVETEAQLEFLSEMDVAFIQGYLYAKPASIQKVAQLLADEFSSNSEASR